jgi:hypothetical protein
MEHLGVAVLGVGELAVAVLGIAVLHPRTRSLSTQHSFTHLLPQIISNRCDSDWSGPSTEVDYLSGAEQCLWMPVKRLPERLVEVLVLDQPSIMHGDAQLTVAPRTSGPGVEFH